MHEQESKGANEVHTQIASIARWASNRLYAMMYISRTLHTTTWHISISCHVLAAGNTKAAGKLTRVEAQLRKGEKEPGRQELIPLGANTAKRSLADTAIIITVVLVVHWLQVLLFWSNSLTNCALIISSLQQKMHFFCWFFLHKK